MQEWLPHQVVVDQSWNETELCAAQPQADVFESVFHEERHAVAVLVSGAQEDVRYAVGVFLEIVEGPRLVFEDKARFVSMLLRSASKHFWHAKVLLLVEVDEGQKSKVAESTASIPGSRVPGQIEGVVAASDDISEGQKAEGPPSGQQVADPGEQDYDVDGDACPSHALMCARYFICKKLKQKLRCVTLQHLSTNTMNHRLDTSNGMFCFVEILNEMVVFLIHKKVRVLGNFLFLF